MGQLGAPLPPGADQSGSQDTYRSTGQASQCVRFQAHQRPYRGGQFAHPSRQNQGPRLRDHQAPVTIVYLVAGKLTQLPTSPFVVQAGLPITT